MPLSLLFPDLLYHTLDEQKNRAHHFYNTPWPGPMPGDASCLETVFFYSLPARQFHPEWKVLFIQASFSFVSFHFQCT